jgi:hypothetical protein
MSRSKGHNGLLGFVNGNFGSRLSEGPGDAKSMHLYASDS